VLDSTGEGDASVIAEGVRFAVNRGAKVINLSLEFSSDVGAADIPELIDALRYAYRRGVVVVAAAGNEGSTSIPYPARAAHVIAVGASTEHGCLANYSNYGRGIALVAPGGGPDASLAGDPDCHPDLPSGRDIFQMTFTGSSPSRFGFPNGYEGTSMATPHVSAVAAMMIAARVLGGKPTPARIAARLKGTARRLGGPADRALYGAGLLDAGAATAPLKAGIAK
jgi:serine protease